MDQKALATELLENVFYSSRRLENLIDKLEPTPDDHPAKLILEKLARRIGLEKIPELHVLDSDLHAAVIDPNFDRILVTRQGSATTEAYEGLIAQTLAKRLLISMPIPSSNAELRTVDSLAAQICGDRAPALANLEKMQKVWDDVQAQAADQDAVRRVKEIHLRTLNEYPAWKEAASPLTVADRVANVENTNVDDPNQSLLDVLTRRRNDMTSGRLYRSR